MNCLISHFPRFFGQLVAWAVAQFNVPNILQEDRSTLYWLGGLGELGELGAVPTHARHGFTYAYLGILVPYPAPSRHTTRPIEARRAILLSPRVDSPRIRKSHYFTLFGIADISWCSSTYST